MLLVAGFGMEAVFLLGVSFARDTATSIVCLTIAVGFSGFAISGQIFFLFFFFLRFCFVLFFVLFGMSKQTADEVDQIEQL